MQQPIIGTKYQMVIPKDVRKIMKAYKPGRQVKVTPIDEKTATIRVVSKNWSDENYGAFKKYWKGVDPIAEVEKIRNEWEERLEELGRGIKK